jgi:hypothetical protein
MSRYDRSHMMATYIDDLGIEHKNQAFKIQGNAPLLSALYQPRTVTVCSSSRLFKFRHLLATFADGRQLQYPVPDPGLALSMAQQIAGAGAACIDLVGEEWGFIPKQIIPGDYRSTPYSGLPPRKTYKSITFDYTPAVVGIEALRLSTRIPTDNGELEACQRIGLEGVEEGGGICNAAGLIDPRHLIIQARAVDAFNAADFREGKVIRKVIVSSPLAVVATGNTAAECAECFGYKGESIANIQLVAGTGD